MITNKQEFDLNCTKCSRLVGFLQQVKIDYPSYHARPVPPFGVAKPRVLIVGLAPGLHGANATGRPFTGDYAGILLYETLYKFGFSSKATSDSATDSLKLKQCRITNAVKCLPPDNKPVGDEVNRCNDYLRHELNNLPTAAGVICLGGVAHKAVLKALGARQKDYIFAHAALHKPDGVAWMLDSYHCSRYNTSTKRLTTQMFESVFKTARRLVDHG
ncbi:MAG: uracil-DNA glycosylase [Thiohalomonadales bacterium]